MSTQLRKGQGVPLSFRPIRRQGMYTSRFPVQSPRANGQVPRTSKRRDKYHRKVTRRFGHDDTYRGESKASFSTRRYTGWRQVSKRLRCFLCQGRRHPRPLFRHLRREGSAFLDQLNRSQCNRKVSRDLRQFRLGVDVYVEG